MSVTLKTMSPRMRRMGEIVLYLTVGLIFVAAVVVFALRSDPGEDTNIANWMALAVNTSILFGYTIAAFKRERKLLSFWICWISILIIHLAAYIALILYVKDVRLTWFLLMYPLEAPIIGYVISWSTRRWPNLRRKVREA